MADTTLLGRALDIVRVADAIVVVGPASNAELSGRRPPDVRFITEDPPGSGPAAAIAAGLAVTRHDMVVVLACDMPFVGPGTVERLLAATTDESDGALLVDATGRRQYLAAAYRTARLRAALAAIQPIRNAPVHKVIATLTLAEVSADPDETFDIDTWNDVARSRRLLEER